MARLLGIPALNLKGQVLGSVQLLKQFNILVSCGSHRAIECIRAATSSYSSMFMQTRLVQDCSLMHSVSLEDA